MAINNLMRLNQSSFHRLFYDSKNSSEYMRTHSRRFIIYYKIYGFPLFFYTKQRVNSTDNNVDYNILIDS